MSTGHLGMPENSRKLDPQQRRSQNSPRLLLQFFRARYFSDKIKIGPDRITQKSFANRIVRKSFLSPLYGGIFYNQKQKKTEVTKMAFSTRRQRLRRSQKWRFSCPNTGFHKAAKQTKMAIFCKRAFWGLIQNLRVRFPPFGSLTRSAPAKTCEKIPFWRRPFWGHFQKLHAQFSTIGS